MTDLRKAAEQALEALEDIAKKTPTTHVRAGKAMIGDKEHVALWFDDSSDPIQQADYINQTKPEKMLAMIKTLRQALAQPDEVLAEREACALIVEHKQVPLNWNDRECFAKAIRARGE